MKHDRDGASDTPPPAEPSARAAHAVGLLSRIAAVPQAAPTEVLLGQVARALLEQLAVHVRITLDSEGGTAGSAVEATRSAQERPEGSPDVELPLPARDGRLGTIALWCPPRSALSELEGAALAGLAALVASRVVAQRLLVTADEHRSAAEKLLATVAHELGSPLAAVLFNVELCVARVSQSADEVPRDWLAQRLKRTRDAVSQVRGLVNGILGVAQLRSGQVRLYLQQVDLSRVVTASLSRLADELEWSGCEVRHQIEPGVTGVWDLLKIEIIVTNLLSNAIKYGAEKPIEIRVRAVGDTAELVVADQGVGIRPEQRARLFQQFSRDSIHHLPGTGLGLWIAHSYVQAHRGKISLESRVGHGTTFTVTLPRDLPPE